MLEHMMFKGTSKNGPEEYSRIIAQNGGQRERLHRRRRDDVLRDARVRPHRRRGRARGRPHCATSSSEQLFEPERKVVMEERRMRTDNNPISFMFESLGAATFLEHPYRQPVIGWPTDIEGWKLTDLPQPHTYYQPNNAFLVAVGDFDAADGRSGREALRRLPARHDGRAACAREGAAGERQTPRLGRAARLPFVAMQYVGAESTTPTRPRSRCSRACCRTARARASTSGWCASSASPSTSARATAPAIDDKTFTLSGQPQPGVSADKLEKALLAEIEAIRRHRPRRTNSTARARRSSRVRVRAGPGCSRGMLLGTYEIAGGWRQIDDFLSAIEKVTRSRCRVAQKY